MRIGEVARASGVSARMLRHYDSMGVVSPSMRGTNDYREYSADDLLRLFHVEALRSLGLSLRETAEALSDKSGTPGRVVDDLIARSEQRLREEHDLLQRLRDVQGTDPAEWTDVLRTIALLRGLDAPDPSARQRHALSLTDPDPRATDPLARAALAEDEPNVGGALEWALARHGDASVPVLTEALRSGDDAAGRRAIAALDRIPSEHATHALREALHYPDASVRRRAAIALGRRGDPTVVPALVRAVASGDDDVEASDALGSLARERGLAAMIADQVDDALNEGSSGERRRLLAVFAELPADVGVAPLERFAEDPDPSVYTTAAFLRVRLRRDD